MACKKCNDTGIIETGNNDLPCDCLMGDAALFNQAGVVGRVTGGEIKRHFLNGCPEPIPIGGKLIRASSLPGRAAEEQRRSFAFGNANLSNPAITRADIDRAADALEPKHRP